MQSSFLEQLSKMEVQNTLLDFIKLKFPMENAKVEELYNLNEDFRALCADYFSCLQMLNKNMKLSVEGSENVTEYLKVKADLESELKVFLSH